MELNRAMRDGSFDKPKTDDTSSVNLSTWHSHFSNLLAKKVTPDENLDNLIKDNIDLIDKELCLPFTFEELLACLKDLKNKKACYFDRIMNEMLKTSGKILNKVFLYLFNSIRSSSFYPTL